MFQDAPYLVRTADHAHLGLFMAQFEQDERRSPNLDAVPSARQAMNIM